MIKRKSKLIKFIIIVVLVLPGCQAAKNVVKKTAQVVTDPSVKVGDNKEQLSLVSYCITADKNVNSNRYSLGENRDKGTPLSFKVIQLKDDALFKGADFEELENDLEEVLGKTYLDHDEYIIDPDQFKFVEPEEVANKTRFIAVIASYSDIEKAKLKAVAKIKPKGERYSILLHFRSDNYVLKIQE